MVTLAPSTPSSPFQRAAQSMMPTPVTVIYTPFKKPMTAPKLGLGGCMRSATLSKVKLTGDLFSQETLKEPLSKADAQARLDAALAAKDVAQVQEAIEEAKRSGLPNSKLLGAEYELQRMMAQDAVVSAESSRDVVALRSAVMRASRLGIDQDTMDMARHSLQVLGTEEMLQIAMRNNVTGHLQKCIDVAQARGADSELIKKAQAMMDKSLAERNLYAVMGGGEEKKVEKLTQAIEEATTAGVSPEEIEEAKQMLETEKERAKEKEASKEKPQIDEVESRLRTAINLQETGALLKAIKLAKRADEAVRENPEYAVGRCTHEESIKEAEQLVAFLEVDLQLPRAIKARDQQKLKAVLTKASTWSIQNEDVTEGQIVLDQLESQEALRLAINSRSEEQLMKAIEQATQHGVDRVRIQKAEAFLAQLRASEQLALAVLECKDPETLEDAIQRAKEAGVSRSEVTKAEALVKSLTRSPTRSLAVSRVGSKADKAG